MMSNPASLLNTAHYKEFKRYTESLVAGATAVDVINTTGSTILAGRVVYISGSSTVKPLIALARANAIATMPAIGITTASIANNQHGTVQFVGILQGVDTSAFAAGDRLYVSAATAGALTATAPVHPNISQAIAVVVTVSATAGKIFILPGIDPHGIELGTYSNSMKIGNATAGAKILEFVANFIGSLSWTPTAARTLTLPDVTDTLVGKATIDVLTNKSYDTNDTGNVFSISGSTITGKTGNGNTVVLSSSPTLETPNIGVANGVSITLTSGAGFHGATSQAPYSLGATATASTEGVDLANRCRAALIAWRIGST